MTAHELSAGYPPSFPFVCPHWVLASRVPAVGQCELLRSTESVGPARNRQTGTATFEKDVCAVQEGGYLDYGKLARGSSNGAVPKKRASDP
jgi:hypothetical protein